MRSLELYSGGPPLQNLSIYLHLLHGVQSFILQRSDLLCNTVKSETVLEHAAAVDYPLPTLDFKKKEGFIK